MKVFTTTITAALLTASLALAKRQSPPRPCKEVHVGWFLDFSIPSTKLPSSLDVAVVGGWALSVTSFGGVYVTHPDLPRFLLSYGQAGCLEEILIDAPPIEGGAESTDFYQTGSPLAPEGVLVKLNDDGGVSLNAETVPGQASEAGNYGYTEGGCFRTMGGSHYSKFLGADGDWDNTTPAVPVYDTYGTGALQAISIAFNPSISPANGFDNDGGIIPGFLVCNVNSCGDSDCIASNAAKLYSGVHVMFFDPSNPAEWAQCQAPFQTCDFLNANGFCSCCGTEEMPSGIRDCFSF